MHLLVQVGIDLCIFGVGMDMATANAACGSGLEKRTGANSSAVSQKSLPSPISPHDDAAP